ncbi:MAG: deoxyribonuclease V [bacterium]
MELLRNRLKWTDLHSWEVSPEEAVQIQMKLRDKMSLHNGFDKIERIAGADVGYSKDMAIGGVVVMEFPGLAMIEEAFSHLPVKFPYLPGLLAFREGPPLLEAFKKIKSKVDLILFDGQGIAHPRRIGIAVHLGLWLDRATIGCAKSRLVGQYSPPQARNGSLELLKDEEKVVGAVVRTKDKVRPIFVSPGHKINLDTSIEIVLKCASGSRVPEPLRKAHLLVNKLREGI